MLDPKFINRLAAWGFAVIAVGILLFNAYGGVVYFGQVNDFPEYWTSASLVWQAQAYKIYQLPQFFAVQHAQFPMLGCRTVALFLPPIAVPFLVPLLLIPQATAPIIWAAILFCALVGCVWLLARAYPEARARLPWLVGWLALSAPAAEAMRIGQLAPFLLLSLCGAQAILLSGRTLAAAAVLSLLFIKPQQMWPLVVFFLGARRYRLLGMLVLIGMALGCISWLMFGAEGYLQYLKLVKDPASLQLMRPEITPTIRGQLMLLLGTTSPVPNYVAEVGLVLASVLIFLLGRRCAERVEWWELAMVGALPLGLLTSMHCHVYDLLLLCPALLIMITNSAPFGRNIVLKVLSLLAVLLWSIPVHTPIHYGYLLHGGRVNVYFLLLLVLSAVCFCAAWRSVPAAVLVAGSADTPPADRS